MHFVFLLGLILIAAVAHGMMARLRSREHLAELVLIYLLVGYCGLPMLGVSLWALMSPDRAAAAFGFTAGPIFSFFAWAYLGMSSVALLALKYRGTFLIAPVTVWAVYLGGATFVHMGESTAVGGHAHAALLEVFAAHGLIAVLLVIALALSGAWRMRVPT